MNVYFGVICAGLHVAYCKHYTWLSPGGLLGVKKATAAPAVQVMVPSTRGLWSARWLSHLGENWAAGAFPPYVNISMVRICFLTECRARDYLCKSCSAQDFIAGFLLQCGTGCRVFRGTCLFFSMGASLVTSQTWDYMEVSHMCLIHSATWQLRMGMFF